MPEIGYEYPTGEMKKTNGFPLVFHSIILSVLTIGIQ